MSTPTQGIEQLAEQDYKYGFVTDIEVDALPKGPQRGHRPRHLGAQARAEWMLEWRLKAFRAWQQMTEPAWPNVKYPPVDYQDMIYYSAPKPKKQLSSLDEVDPEVRRTFEKLGIPLEEQKLLAGVAVDAVFDSVSVATHVQVEARELGIIFCSFSEAVREHPELVRKYLGSVVPHTDNFFAALNSAVFSDGSFVYVPRGVRCPMELSTYFRINARDTGQFERTLIVADEGRTSATSRAARRRSATRTSSTRRWSNWWRSTMPRSSTRQCRTGIRATSTQGGHLQLRDQARQVRRCQLEDHLDAGRDRLGDHLEVPELHPAGRQLGGRVLLGGRHQQLPAGRHRQRRWCTLAATRRAPSCRRGSRRAAARTPTAGW